MNTHVVGDHVGEFFLYYYFCEPKLLYEPLNNHTVYYSVPGLQRLLLYFTHSYVEIFVYCVEYY